MDEKEIVGSVLFTVYNEGFSLEYSVGLERKELIGLLVTALEQLEENEESTVVH